VDGSYLYSKTSPDRWPPDAARLWSKDAVIGKYPSRRPFDLGIEPRRVPAKPAVAPDIRVIRPKDSQRPRAVLAQWLSH
jgi:hypothetical protein